MQFSNDYIYFLDELCKQWKELYHEQKEISKEWKQMFFDEMLKNSTVKCIKPPIPDC